MNNAESDRAARVRQMEQTVSDYFTACNAGDVEGVAATCMPDAVHYFPVHMYGDDEPVRGGRAIGEKWARSVQSLGSRWIIDGPVLCDPGHDQAVIEFTVERKNSGMIIRGSEWYRFDPGRQTVAPAESGSDTRTTPRKERPHGLSRCSHAARCVRGV